MTRHVNQIALVVGAMLAFGSANAAEPPSTTSVVLFNTVCAQCHELECSGRLTFSCDAVPSARARGHMENYAGALAPDKAAELYGLLEYTKTQCDYYAPQAQIPGDGVWSAAALLPLATPTKTGWFVPIGTLDAGKWRLRMTVTGGQPIDIEVMTREGTVAQERVSPEGREASMAFNVADAGFPHFLRLRSRAPLSLDGIALTRR